MKPTETGAFKLMKECLRDVNNIGIIVSADLFKFKTKTKDVALHVGVSNATNIVSHLLRH